MAKLLFTMIIDRLALAADDGARISLLNGMNKSIWLWRDLPKPASLKEIEALSKSQNTDVAQKAKEILESVEST